MTWKVYAYNRRDCGNACKEVKNNGIFSSTLNSYTILCLPLGHSLKRWEILGITCLVNTPPTHPSQNTTGSCTRSHPCLNTQWPSLWQCLSCNTHSIHILYPLIWNRTRWNANIRKSNLAVLRDQYWSSACQNWGIPGNAGLTHQTVSPVAYMFSYTHTSRWLTAVKLKKHYFRSNSHSKSL